MQRILRFYCIVKVTSVEINSTLNDSGTDDKLLTVDCI